jgi:membrane-associated protease RseP (regulator of RpoE activity)
VLWFDRGEAFASAVVRVAIGSRSYEFPFPPPDWATTPSKPGQPENDIERLSTSIASAHSPEHQPSGAPSFKPGVLGVSGETWSQGGVGGVKILEVAQGSAGELAGFRPGYVITEVNGRKIHSTDDLASVLAQKGPGIKVNISYLFWSNLGWMPKETVVILGSGD